MKIKTHDAVKECILAELRNLVGVEERSVVSGIALWTGGNFFALVERRNPEMHVRLSVGSLKRALKEEGIGPSKTFGEKGWVNVSLRSERDIRSALRWVFVAYQEAK